MLYAWNLVQIYCGTRKKDTVTPSITEEKIALLSCYNEEWSVFMWVIIVWFRASTDPINFNHVMRNSG